MGRRDGTGKRQTLGRRKRRRTIVTVTTTQKKNESAKAADALRSQKKAYETYYRNYFKANAGADLSNLAARVQDRISRFDDKIQQADKAAAKGISIGEQRSIEKQKRSSRKSIVERQFGTQVYAAMSPEARRSAERQLLRGTQEHISRNTSSPTRLSAQDHISTRLGQAFRLQALGANTRSLLANNSRNNFWKAVTPTVTQQNYSSGKYKPFKYVTYQKTVRSYNPSTGRIESRPVQVTIREKTGSAYSPIGLSQARIDKHARNAAKRSSNLDSFFRGKGGDSYIETVGRRGIAEPGRFVSEYPEQLTLIGRKTYLNIQRVLSKEHREEGTRRILSTLYYLPAGMVESMNPKKPEGLVNLLSVAAFPSVWNKASKEIAVLGNVSKNTTTTIRGIIKKDIYSKVKLLKRKKALPRREHVINVEPFLKHEIRKMKKRYSAKEFKELKDVFMYKTFKPTPVHVLRKRAVQEVLNKSKANNRLIKKRMRGSPSRYENIKYLEKKFLSEKQSYLNYKNNIMMYERGAWNFFSSKKMNPKHQKLFDKHVRKNPQLEKPRPLKRERVNEFNRPHNFREDLPKGGVRTAERQILLLKQKKAVRLKSKKKSKLKRKVKLRLRHTTRQVQKVKKKKRVKQRQKQKQKTKRKGNTQQVLKQKQKVRAKSRLYLKSKTKAMSSLAGSSGKLAFAALPDVAFPAVQEAKSKHKTLPARAVARAAASAQQTQNKSTFAQARLSNKGYVKSNKKESAQKTGYVIQNRFGEISEHKFSNKRAAEKAKRIIAPQGRVMKKRVHQGTQLKKDSKFLFEALRSFA